jgi:hypothetical protein
MKRAITVAAVLALAGCSTDQPGIQIRTVEKIVEVQKPCPGKPPVRPAPLDPLPGNLTAALAQTLATLAEWSAPGKYGDQAEAYVAACPPSSE